MNIGKILAVSVMVINLGACIGYTFSGDWKKVIYWLAAFALNYVVTF